MYFDIVLSIKVNQTFFKKIEINWVDSLVECLRPIVIYEENFIIH